MIHIEQKLEALKAIMEKQQTFQKEFLDISEASEYLNLSTSTLYKMTSGKELPYYVPRGKKIYFRRTELNTWIEKGKIQSSGELLTEVEDYLGRNLQNQSL